MSNEKKVEGAEMKLDKNTGFPAVEEGQFWQVDRSRVAYREMVSVSLKDGSGTLSARDVPEEDVTKDTLVEAAKEVMELFAHRKKVDSLLGVYPPNKF